jgi:hypothetical protein
MNYGAIQKYDPIHPGSKSTLPALFSKAVPPDTDGYVVTITELM